MSDPGVGVKATFSVQGQPVHQFSSSGATDSPPPAEAGTGEQGPVEGTDKYDHRYTGRHDHGTLPPLKTGGPHGEVVKSILAAKADSDAFLTGLMSQELAKKSGDGGSRPNPPEGPKTEATGTTPVGGGPEKGAEGAEPMELDGSGVRGGAAASPVRGGGALPPAPTPSSAQPAKRPRP